MIDFMKKRGKNEAEWSDKFLFFARKWPMYIDAYDKNNVCIFWNEMAEKISGYSAKEIEGNPEAYAILYPDGDLRNRLMDSLTVRGYDFKLAEWLLTTKNGEKRNLYCINISKLFKPLNDWDHWCIGIDLTALLRAEHDLERRNRELMEHTSRLNELNIALKVLLDRQNAEKKNSKKTLLKTKPSWSCPFWKNFKRPALIRNNRPCWK